MCARLQEGHQARSARIAEGQTKHGQAYSDEWTRLPASMTGRIEDPMSQSENAMARRTALRSAPRSTTSSKSPTAMRCLSQRVADDPGAAARPLVAIAVERVPGARWASVSMVRVALHDRGVDRREGRSRRRPAVRDRIRSVRGRRAPGLGLRHRGRQHRTPVERVGPAGQRRGGRQQRALPAAAPSGPERRAWPG